MQPSLTDRVALVTGAGRGIGRTIALHLASQGMPLGLIGRSRDELEAVCGQILDDGGRAVVVPADVTNKEAVANAVTRSEGELGPVDLLVNNAGIYGTPGTPVLAYDPDEWWRVLEVNVRGPMLLIRAVLPGMLARGRGRIVNIGSYAAIRPAPGSTAYSASKAAILRLTDSLAAEVAGSGISVFAVSPGFVRTEMSARLPGVENFSEDRWDPPEAAAELIARLARGEADALSGAFVHVRDDLDALVARAGDIADGQLFRLRLAKLDGHLERP